MGICAVGRNLRRAPAIGRRGRADRGGGKEVILVSLSVSLAATPSPSGLTYEITIVRGQGRQGVYAEKIEVSVG